MTILELTTTDVLLYYVDRSILQRAVGPDKTFPPATAGKGCLTVLSWALNVCWQGIWRARSTMFPRWGRRSSRSNVYKKSGMNVGSLVFRKPHWSYFLVYTRPPGRHFRRFSCRYWTCKKSLAKPFQLRWLAECGIISNLRENEREEHLILLAPRCL